MAKRSVLWFSVALGVLGACKRPQPMCERVLGRWQGERIEGVAGASPELQAVFRAAALRERWTLTGESLARESVGTERVMQRSEQDGQCVLELANDERGRSSRVLRLSVGEDERLRAVSRGGGESAPVVVLQRVQ
jgi:hypothetical protein